MFSCQGHKWDAQVVPCVWMLALQSASHRSCIEHSLRQNFLNYTAHISQCNCLAIDVCLSTATPGHCSDCFSGLSRTLLCTQPSLEVHWEPNLISLPINQCFKWSLPMCGNKICLLRMFKTVWSCDLCMDVVLYTPLPVSCSVVFWGGSTC